MTIGESKADVSWTNLILEFFALPYSHETSFFLNGRNHYTIKAMGACTMINVFLIFLSFIVLFWPVIGNKYVTSEIVLESFNIPGSVPWNLNKNGGISAAPSEFSNFFGRT